MLDQHVSTAAAAVSEPRVQRRLAAIAIADVVGYSRMMGEDECGTLDAVTARRKQIIEPVVASHQGRVVKLMGDGFFLEFGSAVNAIEAAIALQAQMAQANAGLPRERRIVLRIGINLGEVIVDGEDLYGDGVNVAARLESIAPRGGIVISASACEQVRGRITAAIEDAGDCTLKNIAHPVHVYRVACADPDTGASEDPTAVIPVPRTPARSAAGGDRSTIAVLPFANLGNDPDQGYFSDGFTEDVITELSRWRVLSVRSRAASFQHRGDALDMRQVARDLDVRYLVEGSVRRMGDRLRITAQLIDAATGSHLWAEKYDRAANDIFAVQDELVRTLVSTLAGRVQVAGAEQSRRKPPSSLAAYECVLQANALAWATPEGIAEAERLLQEAIVLDPGYGLPHSLLGTIRCDRWFDDNASPPALLEEAEACARRGVALDEGDSTCHSMLAWVCVYRRQYAQALQHGQRTLALNPGNQWNCADFGGLRMYAGAHQEALGHFDRAREIDPYFDANWYWRLLGQTRMLLEDYAGAVAAFGQASMRTYRISALLAGCHARLGDAAAAREAAAHCMARKPDFSRAIFMAKDPLQQAADAARQAESLRLAGLPE